MKPGLILGASARSRYSGQRLVLRAFRLLPEIDPPTLRFVVGQGTPVGLGQSELRDE